MATTTTKDRTTAQEIEAQAQAIQERGITQEHIEKRIAQLDSCYMFWQGQADSEHSKRGETAYYWKAVDNRELFGRTIRILSGENPDSLPTLDAQMQRLLNIFHHVPKNTAGGTTASE